MRPAEGHIHLPSVHVRRDGAGFDYEEDVYVTGRGAKRTARRVILLVAVEDDRVALLRQTTDELSAEELAEFDANLYFFIDEGNPELNTLMLERGRVELARQRRIAVGREQACASCGCSESRACSGGCVWATIDRCSRCA